MGLLSIIKKVRHDGGGPGNTYASATEHCPSTHSPSNRVWSGGGRGTGGTVLKL
jgi:hypothetical protein